MSLLKHRGSAVLIPFENREAYRPNGWGWGHYATRDLVEWLKEKCGPVGVLWTSERTPKGMVIYFAREIHAIEAALRWGGV